MLYLDLTSYYTLPTKTTAAQNAFTLSYHRVRGLYFLAVVFTAIVVEVSMRRHLPQYHPIRDTILLQ